MTVPDSATMLYLDAAATTPVRRESLTAMWPFLTGDFGNPSSRHTVGESASRGLEKARQQVATFLNCRPSEVIFTGGGTESVNLAIKGIALARPQGRHIVTSPIEHEAVLESVDYLRRLHGFEVSFVSLTPEGVVTPEALAEAVRPDTALVTIAHANNEVGTVQDLEALTAVTAAHRVPFHTDAVQSAAHRALSVPELGVQALSFSGHKLGAPKGTGVLFLSSRLAVEPVLHGGGQERGRRSGTENVAGAVALGAAVGPAALERGLVNSGVRDDFIEAVLRRVHGAELTGAMGSMRLAGHASFVFPETGGEAVLLELERRGVVSSSGSACAAGSDEPSHVLTALGVSDGVASTAVRFTWGVGVSGEQLVRAAGLIEESVAAVRSIVG